jgi:hypothetical protein
VQFSHALKDGMPTDGLYYFYVTNRPEDDDNGGVEYKRDD